MELAQDEVETGEQALQALLDRKMGWQREAAFGDSLPLPAFLLQHFLVPDARVQLMRMRADSAAVMLP